MAIGGSGDDQRTMQRPTLEVVYEERVLELNLENPESILLRCSRKPSPQTFFFGSGITEKNIGWHIRSFSNSYSERTVFIAHWTALNNRGVLKQI
jgi:hypothetical protein